MRTRIFTGRPRRVALLRTLGVTLALLAVPFIGASSASAYPGCYFRSWRAMTRRWFWLVPS